MHLAPQLAMAKRLTGRKLLPFSKKDRSKGLSFFVSGQKNFEMMRNAGGEKFGAGVFVGDDIPAWR